MAIRAPVWWFVTVLLTLTAARDMHVTCQPSGVYMQYDSNADGYIDKETSHVGAGFGDQVQLKLERAATDTLKGYWRASANDEWQDVATVTLTGADVTGLDAGVFATSNSNAGAFTVAFNGTAFGSQTAAVESIALRT